MQKSIIKDMLYANRGTVSLAHCDEELKKNLKIWNELWSKISDKIKDDKDLTTDIMEIDDLSNAIMTIEVEQAYINGVKDGMKLAYEAFVE